MAKTPPLIAHMERYLGKMTGGEEPPDADRGVQVVVFPGQPAANCTTHVTLGLSAHVLHDIDGSPPSRHELILSCYRRYDRWRPGLLLKMVAADVIEDHHVLQRGQILGPHGPLFDGSYLTALYCTVPLIVPRGLRLFTGFAEPTNFLWLVPITDEEADFAFEHGWSSLETLMDAEDPDLLALDRKPMKGVRPPKEQKAAATATKKRTVAKAPRKRK